jgi:hypothetical protein
MCVKRSSIISRTVRSEAHPIFEQAPQGRRLRGIQHDAGERCRQEAGEERVRRMPLSTGELAPAFLNLGCARVRARKGPNRENRDELTPLHDGNEKIRKPIVLAE